MKIENMFVLLITFFVTFACVSADPVGKCGRRTNVGLGNVFGGAHTRANSWPWLVALKHRYTEKFFCGGSLVSERHVISGEVLNMIKRMKTKKFCSFTLLQRKKLKQRNLDAS
jgi:hypothetical protein